MKAPSSNARAGFAIVLLAAMFTYGLIRAFSIRFATGDVYPDYSSMKATPAGAKLLYDSLARTPGVTVSRNYSPLEFLETSNAAVILAGLRPGQFAAQPEVYERLADAGNRVVLSFDWRYLGDVLVLYPVGDGDNKDRPEPLRKVQERWRVKFILDPLRKRSPQELYFTEATDWRVLDRDGTKLLIIERDFGKGSIVLFANGRDFANSSTIEFSRLPLISAALGGANRVIFDEQHFGIAESGTVVGMARRFRLTGMAVGFALCAALFIWKNGSSFPPPAPAARRDTISGRTSLSGLHTLLRRHIKPADLAATCWNEWLVSNGRDLNAERRARAESILRERGGEPLATVREIQTVLHAKGPL